MIVVGVLWFLGNTGWMPVVGWEIVGPILIMAWGLSILASRRRDHTRNERPRHHAHFYHGLLRVQRQLPLVHWPA